MTRGRSCFRVVHADDSTHSVLAKARPVSQSSLEAFAAGHSDRLLPRDEYGHFDVREVDVKTALTRCAMPGEPWTINPYTGCSHDCTYCYVPDVAHVERRNWGKYVLVKRNLPTVLAREMHHKEPRSVFLSSATDPYQPIEREHGITRRVLEILLRHDWPLHVLTRNPQVKRDTDLLLQFTECSVGMSVPTLDDDARRILEPGAPPIEGRLRTLRALADAGLTTFANLMPAFPLTGGHAPDDVARAFRDAGVQQVHAGTWRYLDSIAPYLRKRLAGTGYEDLAATVTDAGYWHRTFKQLERAFQRAHVPLHVVYPEPARGAHMMRWEGRPRDTPGIS